MDPFDINLLQERIETKVTSLIEQHGLQSIYGDNYTFIGQWLHGESQSVDFLFYLYTDLIESGINGSAFYEAMMCWVQYFCC